MTNIKSKHALSFYYGTEKIVFYRVAKNSSTSKVIIKVSPEKIVTASAPTNTTDELVIDAVKQRARWIYTQLQYFQKQQSHVTPRQYISGESHFYLGRRYMLKIFEEQHIPQSVKLLRGQFEIRVHQKTMKSIQKLLNEWYKEKALIIFQERINFMLGQTLWVTRVPPLKLRYMNTQWGNCSATGIITLNPNLIKAPKECIDYVILHELCHIAEHNHSERFYHLMNQVMPGWQKIKNRLDELANFIL